VKTMIAVDTSKDEHSKDGSIWRICIREDQGSRRKIESGRGEIIL
jgi:hypothetical protein